MCPQSGPDAALAAPEPGAPGRAEAVDGTGAAGGLLPRPWLCELRAELPPAPGSRRETPRPITDRRQPPCNKLPLPPPQPSDAGSPSVRRKAAFLAAVPRKKQKKKKKGEEARVLLLARCLSPGTAAHPQQRPSSPRADSQPAFTPASPARVCCQQTSLWDVHKATNLPQTPLHEPCGCWFW